MQSQLVGRLLLSAAVLAAPLGLVVRAACPDEGAYECGCDSPYEESGCAGTESTCPDDQKVVLHSGDFCCAYNADSGTQCLQSTAKDECYTTWDCEWKKDTQTCEKIESTEDVHSEWLKATVPCDTQS